MAKDHPGFDLLKEAFKKFAAKHDGEDIGNRITRAVAAGGEAAVNKARTEFPKSYIKDVAKNFTTMVTSQEVADGVSMSVRSFDEEKVKDTLDKMLAKMQEPETALKIAKTVKDMLNKASIDDMEGHLDQLLASRSMGEQMIIKAVFEQAKPILEGMKNSPVEDVAEQLKDLAATIPTDAIAQQVAAITREVTPERVSKQAHDVVGKLPSPAAVSDILHGVADVAAEKLGKLANSPNAGKDAKSVLGEFIQSAQEVVREKISNDNESKRTFKKDGQDFSL